MKKQAKQLPDTNVIIRYLTRDNEELYLRAKDFFDGVMEGKTNAVILESVIAECIYVLIKIYHVPREEAANSLINILHYSGIANPDRKELIMALKLFSESRIDIVDSILCVKAEDSDAFLFSFDRELNNIALDQKSGKLDN